jgi:hypothetical protein
MPCVRHWSGVSGAVMLMFPLQPPTYYLPCRRDFRRSDLQNVPLIVH